MQVIIKEENFAGKILEEILLEVEKELITVADLIKLKVEQEVNRQNQKTVEIQENFIHPTEKALNEGFTTAQKRLNDIEQEVYRAFQAFQNNGMVIMVNNSQVQELEEEILLMPDTEVSFIRLTQLVGG